MTFCLRCIGRDTSAPGARPRRGGRPRNRGMALLLVMIGMVVCTILTAGFLASQGTSIGIARNERDAQKARVMAQTGVDMCYWLIRNRTDWRSGMTPGNWLTNFPVGDGTVSVKVEDGVLSGEDSSSFIDDPTKGVTLTATGTYDARDFSITATIKPTGGGTVFNSGNFIGGKISLGNSDLTVSVLDSYNSSVASYSALTAGSNAAFTSVSTGADTLRIYAPSLFRGTYTSHPNVSAASTITLGTGALPPTGTGAAVEVRTPGDVILPNTAGLTYRSTGVYSGFVKPLPGRYDAYTFLSGANVVFDTNGLYYATGNMSIASFSTMTVSAGKSVVLYVDGNFTCNGTLAIGSGGSVTIYVNGNITITGATLNSGGPPSRLVLLGTDRCGTINITGASNVYAAIFAPDATMTMQTGSPKFYGAVVANNLTIRNLSQFHFDEALKSLKLTNITGGSAPAGTPEYRVTVSSGPGLVR